MRIQQQHLPQNKDATEEQQWGFTLWEFIEGNWPYLLGIVIILVIFFYARYNWRKRNEENRRK